MGSDRRGRGRSSSRSSSGRRSGPSDARRCSGRFGPEYDRTVEGAGEQARARRAELAARAERRDKLEITPLAPGARERYVERVATRAGALRRRSGRRGARGRRADPVRDVASAAIRWTTSTSGRRTSPSTTRRSSRTTAKATGSRGANALGDGTTEDLRQAMQHYRGALRRAAREASDEPLSRDSAAAGDRSGADASLSEPAEGVRRRRRAPSGIQGLDLFAACARVRCLI